MKKNGYDTDFSLAVTGGSTILSPIIPPSIPAVLLACITGASTGRLFMAGVIPGLLYAGIMMVMITVMSVKRKYPRDPFPKGKQFVKDFLAAFFPLLTPVIILGSIYNGVVTPSEAATLAGVYAILVGLCTRDLKVKELPHIFREGVQLLGSILYITVAAKVFSYIITLEQVPTIVAELMVKGIHSPFGCLMVVAVILLICGCVMDGTATIFIVLYRICIHIDDRSYYTAFWNGFVCPAGNERNRIWKAMQSDGAVYYSGTGDDDDTYSFPGCFYISPKFNLRDVNSIIEDNRLCEEKDYEKTGLFFSHNAGYP